MMSSDQIQAMGDHQIVKMRSRLMDQMAVLCIKVNGIGAMKLFNQFIDI